MTRDLIAEIHEGLQQAGPVRLAHTRNAFRAIPVLRRPRILDVGCGQGGPTLELARLSDGEIIGLDTHLPSLERLASKIVQEGLSQRVHLVQGSVFHMGFRAESLDVIWSEGAIHFVGFERGLQEWRRFVKPGGFIVVHEAIWPDREPPAELREHWRGAYRGIQTAEDYIAAISGQGYRLLRHIALPEDLWWTEYFFPVQERIQALRQEHAGDPAALAILDREEREVDLCHQYPQWYGSAFFVMQKTPGRAATPRSPVAV